MEGHPLSVEKITNVSNGIVVTSLCNVTNLGDNIPVTNLGNAIPVTNFGNGICVTSLGNDIPVTN